MPISLSPESGVTLQRMNTKMRMKMNTKTKKRRKKKKSGRVLRRPEASWYKGGSSKANSSKGSSPSVGRQHLNSSKGNSKGSSSSRV
jgi:hypothetical protein